MYITVESIHFDGRKGVGSVRTINFKLIGATQISDATKEA